jgi:tetratricopeptide (TPR) repeat protein
MRIFQTNDAERAKPALAYIGNHANRLSPVLRHETRMIGPLAPWRSVTEGSDRNQEQEVDCPISDYTKALESDPNNATAYLGRGTAHLKAFDFDSAIADFTRAIELDPNDDSAYTNRGSAHYEKAELAHAIADLNKALEINPKSALAYCNLGWTYEAIGDEQKAIAHYRKALEIDPSLEAARDNLKLLGATPGGILFVGRNQELKGSR